MIGCSGNPYNVGYADGDKGDADDFATITAYKQNEARGTWRGDFSAVVVRFIEVDGVAVLVEEEGFCLYDSMGCGSGILRVSEGWHTIKARFEKRFNGNRYAEMEFRLYMRKREKYQLYIPRKKNGDLMFLPQMIWITSGSTGDVVYGKEYIPKY